jgi:hypothetical protein
LGSKPVVEGEAFHKYGHYETARGGETKRQKGCVGGEAKTDGRASAKEDTHCAGQAGQQG